MALEAMAPVHIPTIIIKYPQHIIQAVAAELMVALTPIQALPVSVGGGASRREPVALVVIDVLLV
jgi:hypothetical protein